MTVAELIRFLEGCPGDLRVVVNGYEEGYDDVASSRIRRAKIRLNTAEHDWEGQHDELGNEAKVAADGAEIVDALILHRLSK